MKERLNKLLTVKSIVTIALTIVFCILAVRGTLTPQEFLTIFTTVVVHIQIGLLRLTFLRW